MNKLENSKFNFSSMDVQWNPVNTDTKGTGQIVRIKRGLRKKVTDTCFLDAKTKANVFTAIKRCLIVL